MSIKPTRICLLIRSLETGGAERQFSLLASQLIKENIDVTVVVMQNGRTELSKRLKKKGIKIYYIVGRGLWGRIALIYSWFSLVQKTKPDIVYSFMATANILTIFSRLRFWKVKIIWGIRSCDYDLQNQPFQIKVILGFEKLLSSFPNLIIYNSDAGMKAFIHLGYKAKAAVVYNGIDTEYFRCDKELRQQFRRKYGYVNDDLVIGFIGRADRMKNIEFFLRAARYIQKKSARTIKVFLAGPMDEKNIYSQKLMSLSNELGLSDIISWNPILTEIGQVFNGIDIFCLTSKIEGFPNVLAEAMACETSCIASDVGDIKLISEDLFPVISCENEEEYKKSLLDLVNNHRTIPRPELRNIIIKKYNVGTLAHRTLAAIGNWNVNR